MDDLSEGKFVAKPQQELSPHSVLPQFYSSSGERADFVKSLFDRTAPRYDWLSRTMSFGTDRSYRKSALRRAGLRPGMKVLDVATGTGLLAGAALELGVASHDLIGIDPSSGMLQVNRRQHSIALLQGVGEALPVRDEVFDFILMGYALRHVADLTVLFAEFHRVLKKSGQVLVLEITRPRSRLGCAVMRLYMQRVVPAVIRLRGMGPDVGKLMEYYWATIEHCVRPENILSALRAAEFCEVKRRTSVRVFSEYGARKS